MKVSPELWSSTSRYVYLAFRGCASGASNREGNKRRLVHCVYALQSPRFRYGASLTDQPRSRTRTQSTRQVFPTFGARHVGRIREYSAVLHILPTSSLSLLFSFSLFVYFSRLCAFHIWFTSLSFRRYVRHNPQSSARRFTKLRGDQLAR